MRVVILINLDIQNLDDLANGYTLLCTLRGLWGILQLVVQRNVVEVKKKKISGKV